MMAEGTRPHNAGTVVRVQGMERPEKRSMEMENKFQYPPSVVPEGQLVQARQPHQNANNTM